MSYYQSSIFITSLVIIWIFALVFKRTMTFDLFPSLILALKDPIKYYKQGFLISKLLLDSKILTQNWIILFLKMALVSCFLTANTKTSNLPIVRLIPRSRKYFIIIVIFKKYFKILTIQGCFFFFLFFCYGIFCIYHNFFLSYS